MARCLRFVIFMLFGCWPLTAPAKILYYGDCALKNDPAVTKPSIVSICVNGDAGAYAAQKSNVPDDNQPPLLYKANGEGAFFLTPWISGHVTAHTSVYMSRETGKTLYRETKRDSWLAQIGNNALSRHRLSGGRGSTPYRINHQLREHMTYLWSINSFDAPLVDYAMYTYDNQLDWTAQISYGQLTDHGLTSEQRAFGSVRLMYDIAALEGTRIVVGGFGDGLLKRGAALGLININGRGDETALEVARHFRSNPYDPKEFNQLIRLSYLSRVQDKLQYKFQYDDEFKLIRVGGFGFIYNPIKFTEIEIHTGYAKNEQNPDLSHWFAVLKSGVRL